MKRWNILISVVVFFGASCAMCKDAEQIIEWKEEKRIAYYDDATLETADAYQREKCQLNITYPANQDGFATLIFLHGGGLRQGTPKAPGNYYKRDFAIATPGYRVAPTVQCPVYIEDAAAANLSPFLVVAGEAALEWPARTEENAFFAAVMRTVGHKKTVFHEIKGRNHGTICAGAINHVCTFIDEVCTEIDKAGKPATTLAEPVIEPLPDEQIEADIDKRFPAWP